MPAANEPRQIEMRLHGNVDWRELWLRLLEWDVALSLCCLRLDVNAPALGEGYHARWERGTETHEEEEGLWSAQIPLTFKGRSIGKLEVKGSGNGESVGDKISMLAKLVQDFEDNVLLVANRSSMQRPISHLTSASVFRAADREDPEFLRANL